MNDPSGKGGGDPLSDAMKRAQSAVAQDSGDDLELDLDLGSDKDTSKPGATNMDFGAIDLGGNSEELDLAPPSPRKKPSIAKPGLMKDENWDDDGWAEGEGAAGASSETSPGAEGQSQPAPKPQKVRRSTPSGEEQPEPQPAMEEMPQDEGEAEEDRRRPASLRISRAGPKRSYAKQIKIALVVILVAGVCAGGYFGYQFWQKSQQEAEAAELQALNQGSLDALKDQAANKEKLGS